MWLNGGALAYMYSTLGSIPDTESKKEKWIEKRGALKMSSFKNHLLQ
jgi:hypothetical protein